MQFSGDHAAARAGGPERCLAAATRTTLVLVVLAGLAGLAGLAVLAGPGLAGLAGLAGSALAPRDALTAAGQAVADPGAGDLVTPFTCPQPTITVLDGADLRTALRMARPGDVIGLEPGTYHGAFTISRSGTAQRPVYLCGPREAVLSAPDQQSGYTLHLDGVSHWRLQGFSVRNGAKGIMIDASHAVVLQGLSVSETGDEAVHLRRGSTGNVVQQLVIRKTGQVHARFGEGLYVGSAKSNWCELTSCQPDRSDDNQLLGNRISLTSAESIDIKEGTRFGVVAGNVFDGREMSISAADSWVDVKGDDWVITGNRGENSPRDGFQVHIVLPGWGDRNTFSGNTSRLSSPGGTGIMLQRAGANIVSCDNVTTGSGRPFSGPCRAE